jgi:hypothetical protein
VNPARITQEKISLFINAIINKLEDIIMTRPDVSPSIISSRLNALVINKNQITVMRIFTHPGRKDIFVKNPKDIRINMPSNSPDIFNIGLRSFISSIMPNSVIAREDSMTADSFITGNLIKNRLDKTAARNAM